MGQLLQNRLDFDFNLLENLPDGNPYYPHQIIEIDQARLINEDSQNRYWEIKTLNGFVLYSESGIPLITTDFCRQASDYRIFATQYNFNHGTPPLTAIQCVPKYEEGKPIDVVEKFRTYIANISSTFDRHYNGNDEHVFEELDVEIAFPLDCSADYNIPLWYCQMGDSVESREKVRYFVITSQGERFQCDCYWWGGDDFYSATDSRRFKILIDPTTKKIAGFKLFFVETETQ